MHPFVRKYQIKPADSIVVSKKGSPFIRHHALYLGFSDDGSELIMENAPKRGVSLITTRTFFSEYPSIVRVERFSGTEYDRMRRLKVAMRRLGRPYHLLAYNCEHLTTEVQTGTPSSLQVKTSLVMSAVLLMLRAMR